MFTKSIAVLALVFASTNAIAQADSDRIHDLQNQIDVLQRRVDALEGRAKEASPIVSTGKQGDSRDVRNWRQLRVGMSEQQVEGLLGVADKVDMFGTFFFWHYKPKTGARGQVEFDGNSRSVTSWHEPF